MFFGTVSSVRGNLLAIQRYPMLVADEAAWGVASTYYAGLRWVSWKVELWWYFREHRAMGTGWERHRVSWLSHLDDVKTNTETRA